MTNEGARAARRQGPRTIEVGAPEIGTTAIGRAAVEAPERGEPGARAPSRRALLAGLAGAALGAVGPVLAPTPARAQDFRIRRGDSLQIEVLEDPSLNRSVLVLPDGSIDFPLAGTVPAAGRTVAELRRALTEALADNFAAEPTVFVSVGALAAPPEEPPAPPPPPPTEEPTIDVFVTGEVAAPGRKVVPPGTTILQIIAEAGGLTRFAAESRIQLRRIDPHTGAVSIYIYDYDATGRTPSIRGGTPLAPGDVVVVPERRLFEF